MLSLTYFLMHDAIRWCLEKSFVCKYLKRKIRGGGRQMANVTFSCGNWIDLSQQYKSSIDTHILCVHLFKLKLDVWKSKEQKKNENKNIICSNMKTYWISGIVFVVFHFERSAENCVARDALVACQLLLCHIAVYLTQIN